MKNNNENKIVASVEFYFKGECYKPETTIDLDQLMETSQESHDRLTSIYSKLAREGNIDTYSYQYEVMLAETIRYSQATGIATDYCQDGIFSMDDFGKAWHENMILNHIQTIAKQHMAIDDLSQHSKLKKALMAAFLKGQKNSQTPR